MVTRKIRTRNPELKKVIQRELLLFIVRKTKRSTGNAKQTSSCWIHCSVTTTRIRTKRKEGINPAQVSLQLFTVLLFKITVLLLS